MRKDLWTQADTQKARELIARHATDRQFRLELGRTKAAARVHLCRFKNGTEARTADSNTSGHLT